MHHSMSMIIHFRMVDNNEKRYALWVELLEEQVNYKALDSFFLGQVKNYSLRSHTCISKRI